MQGTILSLGPIGLSGPGWYIVLGDNQSFYFLHRSDVRSKPASVDVGMSVSFDPAPAFPGKKYDRALRAVISVLPERSKSVRVYLAGRIQSNDWRQTLVDIRNSRLEANLGLEYGPDKWRATTELIMKDGNVYVGPFFVGCDHSCYHGPCLHGAGAAKDYDCFGQIPIRPQEVFQKALIGIAACDLFFAWAGPDFREAYGTLVEIGYAKALKKRVVIGAHPEASKDAWFALRSADRLIEANDPIEAYRAAFDRDLPIVGGAS